jgi:alkaline phosphatase D
MRDALLWDPTRRTGTLIDSQQIAGGILTSSRFYRQLIASGERGATWRLIGSQIVFSRVNITTWFGTEENPYNSGYGR